MNFCPNCGAKIARPGEDQFCMTCGAKIPVLPAAETAAPVGGQAPAAGGEAAGQATAPVQDLFAGDAGAAPGPAFSGVPVTPQPAAPPPQMPTPPPEPRGEDLLSMIEQAQTSVPGDAPPQQPAVAPAAPGETAPLGQPAAPEMDLFQAAAQMPDNLFEQPAAAPAPEMPTAQFAAPGEGFAPAAPVAEEPHAAFRPVAAAEGDAPAVFEEPGQPVAGESAAPAQDLFAAQAPAAFSEPTVAFQAVRAEDVTAQPQAPVLPEAPDQQLPPAQDDLFGAEGATVQGDSLFDAPPAASGQPDMFATAIIQAPSQARQARQEQYAEAPVQSPLQQPEPQAYNYDEDTAYAAQAPAPQGAARQRQSQAGQQAKAQPKQRQAAERPAAPAENRGAYDVDATQNFAYEEAAQQPLKAMKPKRTAPPTPLPEPEPEVKHTNWFTRVLAFFALVITFVVVMGCTIFIMLYFQNRPSKTVEAFAEAIESVDVAKLNELSVVDGLAQVNGATLTDEQWTAFCAAFDETTSLNELKSQLLQQADDASGSGAAGGGAYPAVTIESKPFVWIIDRYYIRVQAVSLLAPGATAGSTLQLDSLRYQGMADASGEVYSGLMPGKYQCKVVPPESDGSGIASTEITIFGVDGHNVLEGEVPHMDITIENCASDDAILYVNEVPVAERPTGGVVSIPAVALGSTIRIDAMVDGVHHQASVVFSDVNATTLRFEDYTTDGTPPASSEESSSTPEAELSESDANAVLGTFYQSYLECINNQNMDAIKSSTSGNNSSLASRISSESNAANVFQFTSAAIKYDSLKTVEGASVPTVQFNATFQYKYRERNDESAAYVDGSNRQSVEMVYQDGAWLVNKITIVSEGDFNNNVIAGFS